MQAVSPLLEQFLWIGPLKIRMLNLPLNLRGRLSIRHSEKIVEVLTEIERCRRRILQERSPLCIRPLSQV